MSAPPSECVVDASVAIKLFLVEPLSEQTDALLPNSADCAKLFAWMFASRTFASELWQFRQKSHCRVKSSWS